MSQRLKTISLLAAAALALGAISAPSYAQQGTLTFTIEATPAAGGQIVPKLTWATTPAATGCTASGASNWTGAKGASGTTTLPAATPPLNYLLQCNWPGETSSVLTWTPPTQNTDGSTLSNLAGYRVLYGASASALTQLVQVPNPSATGHTVTNLTPGQWFFAVKAYNSLGVESLQSSVATKTIAPPFQATQSVGVKVPNPPTNLTAE